MNGGSLSDETSIPLKWVLALLGGASVFVGSAVGLGIYFGSRDAKAENLVARVDRIEQSLGSVEALASRVDRRLFRIEIKSGITVPEADRMPASSAP